MNMDEVYHCLCFVVVLLSYMAEYERYIDAYGNGNGSGEKQTSRFYTSQPLACDADSEKFPQNISHIDNTLFKRVFLATLL